MENPTTQPTTQPKKRKHLQMEVFERFLSPAQIDTLMRQYRGSLKQLGGAGRRNSLEQTIKPEDLELLKEYLDNVDLPLKELSDRHQGKFRIPQSYQWRAYVTAIRWLYQNRHKLD